MKKQDVTAIIVYALILVAAVVFGITVLQTRSTASGMNATAYLLYILGAILGGVVFNSILFELAHVAGAKAGRYLVVSVNILGFCFYKNEENKFKFKFSGFDGLTGETKIIPDPNAKKEPNPKPYLLFGTLFFLVEAVAVIALFIAMQTVTANMINPDRNLLNISYFFVTFGFIGGMMLVYNVLPFQLDTTTDGYRLTLVSNPKNKVAFNELLRVNHELSLGHKDVEVKTFDEITNFTADLNLSKVYLLLDNQKFEEALPLLNHIVESKKDISARTYSRSLAQIIYIKIMCEDLDSAKKFYDELSSEEKRMISQDMSSMVAIRTYILVEGLFEKSKNECLIALNNAPKAYKKTSKERRATEVKLFNIAINKIVEVHPNWGLEKYILKEVEDK